MRVRRCLGTEWGQKDNAPARSPMGLGDPRRLLRGDGRITAPAVFGLLVLLTGCAPRPTAPSRLSVVQDPLDRDREECRQAAAYPVYGIGALQQSSYQSSLQVDERQFAECMRARGYVRQPKQVGPAGPAPRDIGSDR